MSPGRLLVGGVFGEIFEPPEAAAHRSTGLLLVGEGRFR